MQFKSAEQLLKETLDARVDLWKEFERAAFEEMELSKANGRTMARIPIPNSVDDALPLVNKLRTLGYTATITSDREGNSDKRILVGWRLPGPVAEHVRQSKGKKNQ